MKRLKLCEICSKEILVDESRFNRKRFCSRKCFGVWQSQRMNGFNNPAYVGGIAIYTNGKKRIKSTSFEYMRGTKTKIPIHRYLVQKALGRKLTKNEHVHHLNGDQLDNRNINLLLCDISYHRFLHERMSRLYMQEHFVS